MKLWKIELTDDELDEVLELLYWVRDNVSEWSELPAGTIGRARLDALELLIQKLNS